MKGIYIVSEENCVNTNTGAAQHVRTGLVQLNKYFEITLFTLFKHKRRAKKKNKGQSMRQKFHPFSVILKKIWIYGTLKDIYILISNHARFFSYYRALKRKQPLFIYERSAYLNFNGIIIANLLGVPHFYEINGLHYIEMRQYYHSIFNKMAGYLQQKAWKKSTHSFLVGHSPRPLLNFTNYTIIQNGVSGRFIRQFSNHEKYVAKPLNLIFIGHLMRHHRAGLMVKAINQLQQPGYIKLHLVGRHLDRLLPQLNSDVPVEYHGQLPPEEIPDILKEMQVGLNPGGYIWSKENKRGKIKAPAFCFSPIKIFEYLAAKCLVIAPDLPNLKTHFSDREICFFKRDSVNDFQTCLEYVIEHPKIIKKYGEAGHQKVQKTFTWEKVYQEVTDTVNAHF